MKPRYLRRRRSDSLAVAILIAVSLMVAISLMIIILSSTIIEGSKDIQIDYYSMQVQPGDTLWEVTQRMNTTDYYTAEDYMNRVMDINNLQSQTLYQGQRITIPVVRISGQPIPSVLE